MSSYILLANWQLTVDLILSQFTRQGIRDQPGKVIIALNFLDSQLSSITATILMGKGLWCLCHCNQRQCLCNKYMELTNLPNALYNTFITLAAKKFCYETTCSRNAVSPTHCCSNYVNFSWKRKRFRDLPSSK